MVIRPVATDEHVALGELTVAVYRRVLASELSGYAEVLRDVAGRVAAGCEVLVAVDQAHLLGGVTYVPGPGPYAQVALGDEAELRMLVVHPAAQGRGVGAALVRACIARAVGPGRRGLALGTMPEMQAAQRLYRRLGFVRDPARDGRVPGGRRLLCYSLDLGTVVVASSSGAAPPPGGDGGA